LDHDVKQKDVEATIFRDLHRTLPTHVFFQPGNPGQQRLFNVLRAYSRYDRVLGYCQGLGMIVAVVLTYVTEEVPGTIHNVCTVADCLNGVLCRRKHSGSW
jgi:hypothetical protein